MKTNKINIVNDFSQIISFDQEGIVVENHGSLLSLENLKHIPIYKWSHLLESLYNTVKEKLKEQEEFKIVRLADPFPNLKGYYDFKFVNHQSDGSIRMIIYDCTEVYSNFRKYQQKRNELEIQLHQFERSHNVVNKDSGESLEIAQRRKKLQELFSSDFSILHNPEELLFNNSNFKIDEARSSISEIYNLLNQLDEDLFDKNAVTTDINFLVQNLVDQNKYKVVFENPAQLLVKEEIAVYRNLFKIIENIISVAPEISINLSFDTKFIDDNPNIRIHNPNAMLDLNQNHSLDLVISILLFKRLIKILDGSIVFNIDIDFEFEVNCTIPIIND